MPLAHAHKVDDSPFELKLLKCALDYPRLLGLYFTFLGLSYGNMPNVSTKTEYNFNSKIHFLPKLLTFNLEVSNKKDDLLDDGSCYLLEYLYNVLALISTRVCVILACF